MATRDTTVRLTVADNFSTQLRAFATALDQSEKAVKSTSKQMGIFGQANKQLADGVKSGATMALASIPFVAAAAGGAVIKLGMDMEQTRVAFTTLTGSADLANKHLQELRDFAKSTPFQFTELTDASKKMQAFGFATKDVVPMMTDIGDAVSALGAGSQGIDSVVRALGQMQAKGKVSAEEMNQLTEVGISGWKYLAQGIGKSTGEVMKMSEKGLIPAGDAIQYILKGMREDFGGGMAAQSKTAAGQLSNLADSLEEIGSTIGEIMMPAVKGAIGALGEFLNTLKEGVRTADLLINWESKLADAFSATELKIRDSALTYEEYREATIATARAAGLVYDQFVVGQGVVTKYKDEFSLLTQAEFENLRAAKELGTYTDGAFRAGVQGATAAIDENTTATIANFEASITLGDATQQLTDKFIFQKAAEGLSTEAAIQLGIAMGEIDAKTVPLLDSLEALKKKYDKNRDGAIDAAEAAAGYARDVMDLKNNIDQLKDKTVNITTIFHEQRAAEGSNQPLAGGAARGGIIRGASGFITQKPTYYIGEGGYPTFAGTGAEAVIPLNERGINILAEALRRAIGGAGASYNMNVYTQDAASPIREFGLMQALAGAQ